jgi:putative PIN family toxin of toxin-antitoxin system
MRVVLDTNVLVSAVIRPLGSMGRLLQRLRAGDFIFLYSEATIQEIADVLGRPQLRQKYGLQDEDVQTVLALLLLRGEAVTPTERLQICRDPRDDKFLEAAVAGHADALVTGDADLLVLGVIDGIPILTPGAFLGLS